MRLHQLGVTGSLEGPGRRTGREHGSMKIWGRAPLHLPSEAMPESPQHVATPGRGCQQQQELH